MSNETPKHTPGPWAYEFVPDNDLEREEGRNSWSGLYIGREDDERPGQVFRTIIEGAVVHGPNEGDPEADARLIAAAPDMLDALTAIVDCYGIGETPEKFCEHVRALIMEGRNAIAKATATK